MSATLYTPCGLGSASIEKKLNSPSIPLGDKKGKNPFFLFFINISLEPVTDGVDNTEKWF